MQIQSTSSSVTQKRSLNYSLDKSQTSFQPNPALSIVSSQQKHPNHFPRSNQQNFNGFSTFLQKTNHTFNGTQPILVPYISKIGDDEVASQVYDDEEDKTHKHTSTLKQYPFLMQREEKMKEKEKVLKQCQDQQEDGLENCDDPEERKETEQLPITKDFQDFQMFGTPSSRMQCSLTNPLSLLRSHGKPQTMNISNNTSNKRVAIMFQDKMPQEDEDFEMKDDDDEGGCIDVDEESEMQGIEREFNDMEKTMAHSVIRRSVVRKKLNWSQQFNKGGFNQSTKNNQRNLELIQKSFQETQLLHPQRLIQSSITNQASSINPPNQMMRMGLPPSSAESIQMTKRHNYQMSQGFSQSQNAPLLFDLTVVGKELKFITPNMLSRNLKLIDIQNNKIETLPDEICTLKGLEKLKCDQNLIKKLPKNLSLLTALTTLTACNNLIEEFPQGFENLSRLEILLINDNKIRQLPSKIGHLQHLRKLFIHHNLFEEIPIELSRLSKLKEFSLDWFIYLNPPMPKIMRDSKGLLIIDQVKTFCRQFTPAHLSIAEALESEYRSFGDFVVYFHKILPQEINSINFGIKKRSIIHQLCINGHTHLFQNLVCPKEGPSFNRPTTTSSFLIQDHIDLNLQDKEGSTAIYFAFRQNNQDLIDLLTGSSTHPSIVSKVDLDIVSPKFGCPLHICILKHRFQLAHKLVTVNKANPHITNPNGSNALHILFANYSFDAEHADSLARALINMKININLIDNNGLSPIHVAIKKSQAKAMEFAMNYNQNIGHNPKALQEQGFEFNRRGKKGFTPLHYAILKNNHDAFIFLVQKELADVFIKDDLFRSARNLALINSPFYKILYKCERNWAIYLGQQEQSQISRIKPVNTLKNMGCAQKPSQKVGVQHALEKFQVIAQKRKEMRKFFQESNEIMHGNINRRHMNKQVKEVFGSNNYNSVGAYCKPRTHRYLEQESNMQKQKGKTLDRAQTKMIIDQIQGGLDSQMKRIAQKHQDHLSSSKLKYPFKSQPQSNYDFLKSKSREGIKSLTHSNNQNKNTLNQKQPYHFQSKPASENVKGSRVINNIIIQNINVNLNINISIPPSPKSTRGNGSRIDTQYSAEENNPFHLIQSNNREHRQSKKSIKEIGHFVHEVINESVRNEDLSIIDDEMPIQSSVKHNLKATNKEQPKGASGTVEYKPKQPLTSHQTDKIIRSINQNFQGTQASQYAHILQNNFNYQSAHPKLSVNNQDKTNTNSFQNNLSSILQEEPICHQPNLNQDSKRQTLLSTDTQYQQMTIESSFKGHIEDQTKRKVKQEELYQNQFNDQYKVILEEVVYVPLHVKYQALYRILVRQLCKQSSQNDAIDALQNLLQLLSSHSCLKVDVLYILSAINPSIVFLTDFLPDVADCIQQQRQEMIRFEKDLKIKSDQNCQVIFEYELINALNLRELFKKRALDKYPQKSQKLQQYLKSQKTHHSSISQQPQVLNKQFQDQPNPNKVFQYIKEEKYMSGASDTIDEIFDITERVGLKKKKINQVYLEEDRSTVNQMAQISSPTFARKEIIFNQIRNMKIQINQNNKDINEPVMIEASIVPPQNKNRQRNPVTQLHYSNQGSNMALLNNSNKKNSINKSSQIDDKKSASRQKIQVQNSQIVKKMLSK